MIILYSTSKFANFVIRFLWWLPVTCPPRASWHVRVLSITPCLHTQLEKYNRSYWKGKTLNLLSSRGCGHLITWNQPLVGNLNCFSARGGGFEQIFSKNWNAREGVAFDWYIIMTIQLLKTTVKLPIFRHSTVLPRKNDNMQDQPPSAWVSGGLWSKPLFLRFLEDMKLDLNKTNANCGDIISNGSMLVSRCKFSKSREIYWCTRKRQGCTRNRKTFGRGSPPDSSIGLCAYGTLPQRIYITNFGSP